VRKEKLTFDILLPTTFDTPLIMKCLESFRYIPYDYKLHVITEGTWAESVNKGFSRTNRDVLLIDDDIEVTPNTFNSDFEKYLKMADIIGFKLVYDNMRINSAGCDVTTNPNKIMPRFRMMPEHTAKADEAAFMSHVTTSFIYIKRRVIHAGIVMEENWPGYLYEDVDFTWKAFDAGFKILYIPHRVIHHGTQTKMRKQDFWEGMKKNFEALHQRYDGRWENYVGVQPIQLD